MRNMFQIFLFTGCLSFLFAGGVFAQAPAPVTTPAAQPAPAANTPLGVTPGAAPLAPEVLILNQVEEELKEKYKKEIYIPPSIQSLLLTPEQQTLLREARGGFNTKTPTSDETANDLPSTTNLQDPATAVRSLSLGGIVFITPDEWTIWLNKKLVTSAKLPPEAIDLRVYKDFIELRWYDARSNKIFPVRLRPNQTFSIDAQTFIPG